MSLEIEELNTEPRAYKVYILPLGCTLMMMLHVQRASNNNIVGRESYKGSSPGSLKLRVGMIIMMMMIVIIMMITTESVR